MTCLRVRLDPRLKFPSTIERWPSRISQTFKDKLAPRFEYRYLGGVITVMNRIISKWMAAALWVVLSAVLYSASGAAALSPTLAAKLPGLSNSASAGVVIIAFKTQPGSGLTL